MMNDSENIYAAVELEIPEIELQPSASYPVSLYLHLDSGSASTCGPDDPADIFHGQDYIISNAP